MRRQNTLQSRVFLGQCSCCVGEAEASFKALLLGVLHGSSLCVGEKVITTVRTDSVPGSGLPPMIAAQCAPERFACAE